MKNHNQITEMLEIYRQNPEKGFALIYQAFSAPVFRYLRNSFTLSREEAEDILHNVFLPWVQNPQKFATVENPTAYLFTSARNAALKKRAQPREQSVTVEPASHEHENQVEDAMLISRALSALPEEQKEAVVLKVWTDMTFEEIAEVQQCSLQTVASRYRYAIARLKELIPWNR